MGVASSANRERDILVFPAPPTTASLPPQDPYHMAYPGLYTTLAEYRTEDRLRSHAAMSGREQTIGARLARSRGLNRHGIRRSPCARNCRRVCAEKRAPWAVPPLFTASLLFLAASWLFAESELLTAFDEHRPLLTSTPSCKATEVRFSNAPECASEPSRAACWAVSTARGRWVHETLLLPEVVSQFRERDGCAAAECGDIFVRCASPGDSEDAAFAPAALIALAFLAAAAVCEHGVTRPRDALALLALSGTVGALVFPEHVSDANGVALVFVVASAIPAIVAVLQGTSMLFIQLVVGALTISMLPALGILRLWRAWCAPSDEEVSWFLPANSLDPPELFDAHTDTDFFY